MNIEFSRIMPNLKLDGAEPRQVVNVDKNATNAAKQLFSDSLVVKESENFSLGDMDDINMDEVEKELVRDDKLGKLFSSQFNFKPPEMPVFV
jgi:hypothetical protein